MIGCSFCYKLIMQRNFEILNSVKAFTFLLNRLQHNCFYNSHSPHVLCIYNIHPSLQMYLSPPLLLLFDL